MRIVRMRVANFRGVEDRTVAFAVNGVTVLEGPNEIGKSTIAEALNLLLTELDSANTKETRAVKPVHRDAAPEVELDAVVGAYEFHYRKRFLRGAATELVITRPRPQNLSGREAHDRVLEILKTAGVDLSLWRALRLTQGDKVGQAAVSGFESLRAALDTAAGTVPVGPAETSLWERARAEYGNYWTDGGKAKGPAAEHQKAVADQRAALEDATDKLSRLERDIERVGELRATLDGLAGRRAEADAAVRRHEETWQRVLAAQGRVEALEARAAAAEAAVVQAARAQTERQSLMDAAVAALAERERLAAIVAEAAPELERAVGRARAAAAALAAARLTSQGAAASARECRAAAEVLRSRQKLADLRGRHAEVTAARAEAAAASAALEVNRLDAAGLAQIRDAHVALARALAVRDAALPTVTLSAQAPVSVDVGGSRLALAAGQVEQRPVDGALEIALPGQLTVRVTSGTGGDASVHGALAAQEHLNALLARAKAEDLASAEAQAQRRADAGAARDRVQARLRELLGPDLERGQTALDAAIATLEGQLALTGPAPAGDLAALIEASAVAVTAAEAAEAAAQTAVELAEPEDAAASARQAELGEQLAGDRARVQMAAEQAALAADRLAEARAAAADAQLSAAVAASASAAAEARTAAGAARDELAALGPDAARLLLDNALAVREGADIRERDMQIELAEVRSRLRDHGEEGLAERRDAAVRDLQIAERALEAYTRAAESRRILYEALKAARDEANRAYVAPLQARVEALGKIVFGASLGVQIGEDLQVRERTLEGRTLPFESLSVGAREQLAIITRLACAMIVAPAGGVPVILDDGLGWSDPRHLEAMGAVLKVAGEQCQVIVLTCYPDRYRSVGGATVVALA